MKRYFPLLSLIALVSVACIGDSKIVPYNELRNYFVRNDAGISPDDAITEKITDDERFDALLGMAATMGGLPTQVDFGREFVVAVIAPVTNRSTRLTADSLVLRGSVLTLYYTEQRGAEMSYSVHPMLALVADRKYDGRFIAVKNAVQVADVPEVIEQDTVTLRLSGGNAGATVKKSEGKTVYIEFDAAAKCKLSGRLSSDDPAANVRFSQIIMPDGSADGPFGREIEYDLPAAGRYRLLVNENIMAGDPWSGVFTVGITLKE